MRWNKTWLYTLFNELANLIKPPKEIQNILDERERQFYLSDAGTFEFEQINRFQNVPLSKAVKEHDQKQIDSLLKLKDLSVGCYG